VFQQTEEKKMYCSFVLTKKALMISSSMYQGMMAISYK